MAKSQADIIIAPLERLARLMRADDHSGGLKPAQWEALRYLGRCNGISDSPGCLTQYLAATKGTVSQTVISLEKKGLVQKSQREGSPRSVRLSLTKAGKAKLAEDPLRGLEGSVDGLSDKAARRLFKGLEALMEAERARTGAKSFGRCRTCRFFREKGADSKKEGPHLCLLLNEPLSKADSKKICVEHEPA